MNILINFEDKYGCHTLFTHVNKGAEGVEFLIRPGLGNGGVFRVSRKLLDKYDFIVIVFDLDDDTTYSMTSDTLLKRLGKNIIDENGNFTENSGRVILIPVFCCFETLYLFSGQVRNAIADPNSSTEGLLINKLKSYYDYSKLNPENMRGIVKKLNGIRADYYGLDNNDNVSEQGSWYPQHFHERYARHALEQLFAGASKFGKNTGKFFEYLTSKEHMDFIISIVNGLSKYAKFNIYIYKLITMRSINDIMYFNCSDENLKNICEDLDEFNSLLQS